MLSMTDTQRVLSKSKTHGQGILIASVSVKKSPPFLKRIAGIGLAFWLLTATSGYSQTQPVTIPVEEFRQRRHAMLEQIPDGLLLLHARSVLVSELELYGHGFQQNPSFLYFTGLASVLNAILVLDGVNHESWLFVPTSMRGLAGSFKAAQVKPEGLSEQLLLDHVVAWDEFVAFMNQHLAARRDLTLYVDGSHWSPSPESNPPGLLAVADPYELWKQALLDKWPAVKLVSAKEMISELRLVKSAAEIQIIRQVAHSSALALLAGLRSLRPGKTQRQVEADIVAGCIAAGAEGPSFWPWVMSGPNAILPRPLESLVDYRHLNRVLQSGDLVRVDVGCDADFYKGDVGRTAPASGRFDDGQKETWELLLAAYHAGLNIMRDGTTRQEIEQTCRQAVAQRQAGLKTDLARKAAAKILEKSSEVLWHLHGSGLEPGEGRPTTLMAGMIIEFEPMFSVEGQAFYLEDMILVTQDGHEVLTKDLPYAPAELTAIILGGSTN